MARGRFITFEGGEGVGKSTQARLLTERLRAAGVMVTATREPGGSPGAEAIRALLVRGDADRWSPVSETLLFFAARRDHIERLIRPELERGAWVVCDRFTDSTRAYQAIAGEGPMELISELEQRVLDGVWPDLTLVLDMEVDAGLGRAASRRGAETRFEDKGLRFHDRLRAAFRDIATSDPGRCVLIDAAGAADAVAARVLGAVNERLGAAV